MKTLSIIIPVFNNRAPLVEMTVDNLAAIRKHASDKFITEIIGIDNGSLIQPQYDFDKYTYWPENRGVAPAWNEGWRQASGDFICWMNTDVTVQPHWDFPLVVVCEQMDVIAMPLTNGDKSHDGLGIAGWCFMTRRHLADKIGPFDESFVPVQYEDTDWFHRAIYQHGIAICNVPASNVLHVGRASTDDTSQEFRDVFIRNRRRYSDKHHVDMLAVPPFWQHPLPDVLLEDT